METSDIQLIKIDGKTLKRVIDYCVRHRCIDDESENKIWDGEFLKIPQEDLYYLILAADYLDNTPLFDLTTKKVSKMIEGKSAEEIKNIFNIAQ
jgi:S-phase kinase-associated protein 1